jgi:hypothetical protein
MSPDERELVEAALGDDDEAQGGDDADQADDPPNWYRAFTLLRSVGHTQEDILEMSPQDFKGFLHEARRLQNEQLSMAHTSRWLTAKAASVLSAPFAGDDHGDRIEEAVEQVLTYHKSLRLLPD